jgi:predicted RNA-binding Zn ribbon-like protein
VPSWYPWGSEAKPAPMPLLLVQGFVNTRDLDEDTDLLVDPDSTRRWLIAAGLLDRAAGLGSSELEFVREVRDSIRSLIEAGDRSRHLGGPSDGVKRLAATHRARLTIGDDGDVVLENARNEDLGDALFELLLIVYRAQQDGTWSRLKVCGNPDCQWAFFDRSRNQQGSWCDMAVCGNRLKNRQLRARRR